MNKRSYVGNVRYFYSNDEYSEDIADMICKLHHLNVDKSFIQQQNDQNF